MHSPSARHYLRMGNGSHRSSRSDCATNRGRLVDGDRAGTSPTSAALKRGARGTSRRVPHPLTVAPSLRLWTIASELSVPIASASRTGPDVAEWWVGVTAPAAVAGRDG